MFYEVICLIKIMLISARIGTGMCVFSKLKIISVLSHIFSANGYPHLIHEGDWYCAKGVGLTRIETKNGFRINFYVTHVRP